MGTGQKFKAPFDGIFLKIIAQTPVTEHLEEGQVRVVADFVNIARANAFLEVGQARAVGVFFAHQKGNQRVHSGGRKKDGRVVFG